MEGRRALLLACLVRNPAAGGAAAARGCQVKGRIASPRRSRIDVYIARMRRNTAASGTHFREWGTTPSVNLAADTSAPSMGFACAIPPQRIISRLRRGTGGAYGQLQLILRRSLGAVP